MSKAAFRNDPETYILSSCAGKEAFDRATANLVARKSKHPGVRAYSCAACGSWHVGQVHKPKAPKKRKRRHVV